MKHGILTVICCVIIGFASVDAQEAPRLLPFQGRLTDQGGTTVSNGVRVIQFKAFTQPSSGSPVWSGEIHRTTVNAGLVNVVLGTKNPLTSVDFSRQLFLEITVDIDGDNAITPVDPPMLPRQAILPVIFAVESENARKLQGADWGDILQSPSTDPRSSSARIKSELLADERALLEARFATLEAKLKLHEDKLNALRLKTQQIVLKPLKSEMRILANADKHGPVLVSVFITAPFYDARYVFLFWHDGIGGTDSLVRIATVNEFDQFNRYGFPTFQAGENSGFFRIMNPKFIEAPENSEAIVTITDIGHPAP